MQPVDVARHYFNAWNRHDPTAILATFAEGGSYSDPTTGGALRGEAIAAYAGGLFAVFPDLSFEIVSAGATDPRTVAAQWVMRGTQSGPMSGLPPSGRAIELPGSDFIVVEGDRIRSVQGYFDQKAFLEQLGLQVIAQPFSIGPAVFGTSSYVPFRSHVKPGAFSLTALQVRSDEEVTQVREISRQITREMAQMPGALSFMGVVIGHRMYTIAAWEDAEQPRQLLMGGAHKEAMAKFFGPEISSGGQTSVWIPERLNALWVRCPACGRMANADAPGGRCRCGEALPEPPPYW
jgi:steroid delta-isomerase-like uncharacterized protein